MTARGIEPVHHGGDLDAARRQFPEAPQPWIDLSTGINPHSYAFASPGAAVWADLPQRSAELALRQAAALRYGVTDADMIVAAPGTQALIQVLPRLVEATDVIVLAPTYAEHAVAWARHGHRVIERESLDDIGAARIVVVVNPNNPTGRIIERGALVRLAEAMERRAGLLVVDEAFADFTPEVSVAPELPERCVVMRSFGKAYGLAGVRLGFAIAQGSLAARLRDELGPWAVSGPALAIGAAALSNADWLQSMKVQLADDCKRLDALLTDAGLEFVGGTHLLRLFAHAQAKSIARTLGRHGIWVRSFVAEPSWLRFGLPGHEAAWDRLELALQEAVGAV